MLADVAQEFQESEFRHPIVVIHQHGRIRAAIEIQEAAELFFHAGDVCLQRIEREQVSLFAFSAGVADHSGGPAHQRDGPVPGG